MEGGVDYQGREKIPIEFYNYRVEIQARGMPHIHAVAWIDKKWLKKMGVEGDLVDYPETTVEIADRLITTALPPEEDEKFRKIVKQVQTHGHTKSCLKRTGFCRYNIPRPPSKKTIVAKPFSEMTDEEKKELLGEFDEKSFPKLCEKFKDKAKAVFGMAQDYMENKDISKNDWAEFFEYIFLNDDSYEEKEALYYKYLSVTERGHKIIYAREIKAAFINNYNEEMLRAWQGKKILL